MGMLPSCWGPPMWHVLHSIAYMYNPQTDRERYLVFFNNLGQILPCEECRLHYSQNFNKNEFMRASNSQEDMFRWVYDLHNKVNKQTGVPESKWPSYKSVIDRYESFKTDCSNTPGVCGASSNLVSKKKMKLVEQFGDINEEQLPFLISTIVLIAILLLLLGYIYHIKQSLNNCLKKYKRTTY